MNNKGFSLTELVVTIVISSIVILAIAVLFWGSWHFMDMANKEIEFASESRIAMATMTKILRFAQPSTIVVDSGNLRITCTISGGHLDSFPSDDRVRFLRNTTLNTLRYRKGNPWNITQDTIENLTDLEFTWNDPILGIKMTVDDGDNNFTLQTAVQPVGEM
ncbi:PilW family protein [Candidatus Omnitrophota bacterium]